MFYKFQDPHGGMVTFNGLTIQFDYNNKDYKKS